MAISPKDYNLTKAQANALLKRYGLTPSAFRALPEHEQLRKIVRAEAGDLPSARAEFGLSRLKNDEGVVPVDGPSKAMDQLIEMKSVAASPDYRGRFAGLSSGPTMTPMLIKATTAGLQPDNMGWTAMGPGKIGGRIRSLLINPENSLEIWIGSVGGGVWLSRDDGQSWNPSDDLMANLAVCSMVMDPTSSSTIYAGTGEGFSNGDKIRGQGIFKTLDGSDWEPLPFTKNNADFYWVNGLTITSDGATLLAGTSTGIWRSTDSGETWKLAQVGNVGNVAFHHTDDSQAVSGLQSGEGTYYSTDGGASWTASTQPKGATGIGRIQVCYSVKTPSIVYASVEASPSELWCSTDGGATYCKKKALTPQNVDSNFLSVQGFYDNIIWAGDPTNENFVIVGGVDLWKSTDGGDTLDTISNWMISPVSPHGDHHIITTSPEYNGTSNKTVYFGNDGGIYKTTNVSTAGDNPYKTNGWINLNNGLSITQFYAGAGSASTGTVICGAQDNGTIRYTPTQGADGWSLVISGDGGYVASDPSNANNFYGEYITLQIFRSTDGGAPNTSQYICGRTPIGTWKPAPYTIPDAKAGNGMFIAPFIIDPNNPNCLLAGGQSLWRCDDPLTPNTKTTGPSWAEIKPPCGKGVGYKGSITAICCAPGNSDLMFVGHENGLIYKSTDATQAAPTWTEVAFTGINASRACNWLAIDKNNNNVIYAAFSGYQANNAWKSTDGGATWNDIGATLPDAPIHCITIHPQDSNWIYIGTEVGIFSSENGGTDWSPNNEGPTNCAVWQLFWLGNKLHCATHGRGLFSIDLTIHLAADQVVTGDLGGTISSFDASTGALSASYPTHDGQISAAPLIEDTMAYCGYELPFKVAKFNTSNLTAGPIWEVTIGGGVNGTPDLIALPFQSKSQLFVAATDGKLYALDATTGEQDWSLQVVPDLTADDSVKIYSSQVSNQWVYLGSDKGLYAVNTETRTVGWSKPNIVCNCAPLLASDAVYASAEDGNIYAVGARSGSDKWAYDTGAPVASTPVWILGSIIVGNQSGTLIGLDYDTGAEQFRESHPGEQIQAITADGNELFFVGNAGLGYIYNYRLDISGTKRALNQVWKTAISLGTARPPQVVGYTLYLTTPTKLVIAFNTRNGEQLWVAPLNCVSLASPALVY